MAAGRTRERAPTAHALPTVPAGRRLLVPVDFSDLAAHAIPWAYALAGPGGCVVLLHVVDPETMPNPLYAHYEPGHAESREERAVHLEQVRERLRALVPATAPPDLIPTEVEVVEDAKVAAGIRRAAERLRADAIVLGSHCRRPLGRTILGSIAEELLRAAHIPVFAIPPAREPEPRPARE